MNFAEIFSNNKTIAVIGMSKNTYKAAHTVPAFMMDQGYKVIPINPTVSEIMGLVSYSKLSDVPDTIDILNVFRPSEDVPDIVREAVERHKTKGDIKLIWLQDGIYCDESKSLATLNGIEFVQDRCIYRDYNNYGNSK